MSLSKEGRVLDCWLACLPVSVFLWEQESL